MFCSGYKDNSEQKNLCGGNKVEGAEKKCEEIKERL
jgi:hypothetical protein